MLATCEASSQNPVRSFWQRSFLATTLVVVFIFALTLLLNPEVSAITNTTASDISNNLRLKQGSALAAILQIQFGSNENGENLNAVSVALTATAGTPSWTQSAASSSELLDLATSNGGVSLWKETNSQVGLQSAGGTPDSQVTLAASPQYSASNIFTLLPAVPPALVTDELYYIALKSDSAGVT